jgi:Secretion system C-terminal sorting domain
MNSQQFIFLFYFALCFNKVVAQSFAWEKDYLPGILDSNGTYMGGTEIGTIRNFDGKLYAAVSYWMDFPNGDSIQSAQILVKECSTCNWKVDFTLPSQFMSIETLNVIEIEKDNSGTLLSSPKKFLMASANYFPSYLGPYKVIVWFKEQGSTTWKSAVVDTLSIAAPNLGQGSNIRAIISYTDRSANKDYVFAVSSPGGIYRGSFDNIANTFVFNSTPEYQSPHFGRGTAFAIANSELYCSIRPNATNTLGSGGVFKRNNKGINSSWSLVYQPPISTGGYPVRGLTALKHPTKNHEVLYVALEYPGIIGFIDPNNNYNNVLEFQAYPYFNGVWANSFTGPSLMAYNDFATFTIPNSTNKLTLISLWADHPRKPLSPYNGAWYLIRDNNGNYKHELIYDFNQPLKTNEELRATRTFCISPFPEDDNLVIYAGGFDAGGYNKPHNTAWIYKGTYQKNTGIDNYKADHNLIKIFPNPSNSKFNISIDAQFLNPKTIIKIYNSLGVLIFQKNISHTQFEIDLQNYRDGIYYLNINNGSTHYRQKIIKH